MAPITSSDTSVSITAASRTRTITSATGLAPSKISADQRRSPLMTLPKELRNRIYNFVLYDDADIHKPTAYCWDYRHNVTGEPVHLPNMARLGHTAPPPLIDCILACRQIHSEMKQMHAAAHQAYWTSNCFIYSHEMSYPRYDTTFPPDQIIARNEHLVIDFDHKWYFYMSFNGLQWDSKLLPAEGHRPVEFRNSKRIWSLSAQSTLQDIIRGYQAGGGWLSLNPLAGRGFTRDKLMAIERRGDVAVFLRLVR